MYFVVREGKLRLVQELRGGERGIPRKEFMAVKQHRDGVFRDILMALSEDEPNCMYRYIVINCRGCPDYEGDDYDICLHEFSCASSAQLLW